MNNTENRISRDRLAIEVANLFSLRATCCRLKVGAVATLDGRIISTGYNGPVGKHCNNELCDVNKPCERAIHAEANLIAYAAKNGISLNGSKLYITHSPCEKCCELIIQSGINHVVYKTAFRNTDGLLLLLENNIKVELYNEQ